MKNQKGVTLIVLATTVAIIAIILGSISYTSVGSMRMRSYYNMCADIELLEEKIALYYLQHKTLPILQNETKSMDEIISNYSEFVVNQYRILHRRKKPHDLYFAWHKSG